MAESPSQTPNPQKKRITKWAALQQKKIKPADEAYDILTKEIFGPCRVPRTSCRAIADFLDEFFTAPSQRKQNENITSFLRELGAQQGYVTLGRVRLLCSSLVVDRDAGNSDSQTQPVLGEAISEWNPLPAKTLTEFRHSRREHRQQESTGPRRDHQEMESAPFKTLTVYRQSRQQHQQPDSTDPRRGHQQTTPLPPKTLENPDEAFNLPDREATFHTPRNSLVI